MPRLAPDGTLGPHVVDGVLVLDPATGDEQLAKLTELGLPIVTVGHDPRQPKIPHVVADYAEAMRQMLEHLRGLGARRLGVLAPRIDREYGALHLQVAEQTWVGEGEEFFCEYVDFGDEPFAHLRQKAERLMEVPELDAAIGLFSTFGSALIRAAQGRNLSVPGDVLVAQQIDGVSAVVTSPALTAVDLRPARQAEVGIAALLELLAGGTPPLRQMVAPKLQVRTSTVARRRGDRMLARREETGQSPFGRRSTD